MKIKEFIGISAAMGAALLLTVSCEKFRAAEPATDTGGKDDAGRLSVRVEAPQTRAVYTDIIGKEGAINNATVFIFAPDSRGALRARKTINSGSSCEFQLNTGSYQMFVVSNASEDFSGVTKVADITSGWTFKLSNDNPSVGFQGLYYNSTGITVNANAMTSVTASVSRVAARVALVGVTNATSSAITVKRVFLSNVAATYCDNSAASPTYINQQGRNSRTETDIIDSASDLAGNYAALTYADINTSVAAGGTLSTKYPLYCYQNRSTTAPAGFTTTTYAGEYTTLVVVATVGGKDYYYPVVLDPADMGTTYSVERNKAYSVSLTIGGRGSNDPNNPVTGVSTAATVQISDWITGDKYEKSFN